MLNKTKRSRAAALTLAVIMCLTLLSGITVFADTVQKTVTVSISGDSFYLPPEELTVSSGIAYEYGYEDADDGKVSVFDALVAAHKYLLGDEFTKETANDYLVIYSSGWISKVLGNDSSTGFFVNDRTPNDGVYNPAYESYTSYMADQAYLEDNDIVTFFFYQDLSYWSDYYSFFDKREAMTSPGSEVSFNLSGFISFAGCKPEESISEATEPISDTKILLGTDKNFLDDTGVVTDEEGNFTLKFNEPGTYYMSAQSYSDEFTYFVLPWCEITVTEIPEPTATATTESSPSTEPTATAKATSAPLTDAQKESKINNLVSAISSSYYDTADAWTLFDMVCGGYKSKLTKRSESLQALIDEVYVSDKIGETSRDALAIKALGGNLNELKTTDGAEFDLIKKLSNFSTDNITYVTDAIFAMTVYDSGEYTADGNLTREALLNYILTSRNEDGIWGYTWNGVSYPDYDSTAMALNALAPYYNADSADKAGLGEAQYNEVKNAVDSIVSILSSVQGENGTYYSSNTDAVVIIGLTSIGIDPYNDERFVKNGNSVVDGLLNYALEDNSGFGYTNNSEYNVLGTEQSFRALIAYLGFKQNSGAAYDIYDINPIKPVSASNTQGTGGSSGSNSGGSTGSGTITVTVSVVGDTAHGEGKHTGSYPTWISSVKKTISSGTKVADVLKTVLEENGYSVKGIESGYISSITSPDGVTIGEFTNGKNSGWLYTVNGKAPSVGIDSYTLKSGDTIKLYYSDDYTKETNSSSGTGSSGSNNTPNNNSNPLITDMAASTSAPVSGDFAYSDLPTDHWANNYIMLMSEKGLIKGYDDGTFKPDINITRAELVTILYRVYNTVEAQTSVSSADFIDVDAAEWYAPYINWAAQSEYVKGYEDGTFMPDEYITREDICVILNRIIEKQGAGLSVQAEEFEFTDSAEISDYAQESVENMRRLGVVSGKEDNRFAPKENATRAEVSKMVALSLLN